MPASRFTQTGNYRTRYAQDQTIFATYAEQLSLIVLIGLLLLLPLILPKTMLRDVNMIMIYAVAVIGLNITTGYTGLINIGQAAFMGVGAYATALAATRLNLPFFLAIPIGGSRAHSSARLSACPACASSTCIWPSPPSLSRSSSSGAWGTRRCWRRGRDQPAAGAGVRGQGHLLQPQFRVVLPDSAGAGGHGPAVAQRAAHQAWALADRRADNDRAAAAMGINPGTAKIMAFMIGSFYAGIAGGLFAYFQKAVVIEDYGLHISIQLLAMAIVGGLGSLPVPSWGRCSS